MQLDENISIQGISIDRKDDYQKMKRNLEILQQFCERNFINIQERNNFNGGKKEKKLKKLKKNNN